MKAHEARVMLEQGDLALKIEKLKKFLGSGAADTVRSEELILLQVQLLVMTAYSQILSERIKLFTGED